MDTILKEKIVIDPGHGGENPMGKSSPFGLQVDKLYEKDVTLSIAYDLLNAAPGDLPITLTRSSDFNLPLHERIMRAQDATVFLSLHCGSHIPFQQGLDIWLHPDTSDYSHVLGNDIYHQMTAFGMLCCGVWQGNLALIHPAYHSDTTAACLIECNPKNNFNTSYFVHAILSGIACYLDKFRLSKASRCYGGLSHLLTPTLLTCGVPAGIIITPFYRSLDEYRKLNGESHVSESRHLGIDVSLSNAAGGGAHDLRRGLELFATPRPSISLSSLNAVRAFNVLTNEEMNGLDINAVGYATLESGKVKYLPNTSDSYGASLALVYKYRYSSSQKKDQYFYINTEYRHLITEEFLPKDGDGNIIPEENWRITGKNMGFGPLMKDNSELSSSQLSIPSPALIGYIGATELPHVHIECSFSETSPVIIKENLFDPTIALI